MLAEKVSKFIYKFSETIVSCNLKLEVVVLNAESMLYK